MLDLHQAIEGDDIDFYKLCANEHVRDTVRQALRRFTVDPKDELQPDQQLLLPGYERLRKGYLVDREGVSTLVPVQMLTASELDAKIAEYERMAVGCHLHADELRRYKSQRAAAA